MTPHPSDRFAVVPSRGCYGSGERVRAVMVTGDAGAARRAAARLTREYRRGMPGYTSGGYRVVATTARTRRTARWLGCDLDREPSL